MANACMFKNKMKKGEASRRMQGIIWLTFKKTKRNKEKGPFYFFLFKESVFKYYYSLRNLCGVVSVPVVKGKSRNGETHAFCRVWRWVSELWAWSFLFLALATHHAFPFPFLHWAKRDSWEIGVDASSYNKLPCVCVLSFFTI